MYVLRSYDLKINNIVYIYEVQFFLKLSIVRNRYCIKMTKNKKNSEE